MSKFFRGAVSSSSESESDESEIEAPIAQARPLYVLLFDLFLNDPTTF